MANYESTVRTNYFHVKDTEKFRAVMRRVYGCEDTVELWEEKDKDGGPVFGFGVYGGISGILPASDDKNENSDCCDPDDSYYDFLRVLQECVADDDAIIILESGNEKMRYVVGNATVITGKEIRCLSITDLAVEEASKMLGNPNWETVCRY